MPLVVPDMADSDDQTAQWYNKLVGKKLHDEESNETNFCKRDLPEEHRVIHPNSVVTRDFKPNRLNVHLNEEGTVTHVQHG